MSQRINFFNAEKNIESQIKETFYNGLANYVILHGNVTIDNLDQKLIDGIAGAIYTVLKLSKGQEGLNLPTGAVVTLANCPLAYKGLFESLMALKQLPNIPNSTINTIAKNMMQFNGFREVNPRQFLMDALNLAPNKEVAPQLVRDTFYNEMLTQSLLAVEKGWLTYEDLKDQEVKIFTALSALTLIEAVEQSRASTGIRLLNSKILDKNNCPQGGIFLQLLKVMLRLKELRNNITDAELEIVRHNVAANELLPMENKIRDMVVCLNGMAMTIAQAPVFKQMIGQVIEQCCEMLQPQSASGFKPF